MRIVVVGASRLGVAIVSQLLEDDHDVVLTDSARDRLDEVADRLDCGFIEGDGTLPQTLRDAYGDGAEVLMLMTNHDDVNILGAVVGKSIGFKRVILQIVRAELLEVCDELGFDEVITPHATVARSIVRSVRENGNAAQETRAAAGLTFQRYNAPSSLEGETLGELILPEGARAVAIMRGKSDAVLDSDAAIEEGDQLLVALTEKAHSGLTEMLGKPSQT